MTLDSVNSDLTLAKILSHQLRYWKTYATILFICMSLSMTLLFFLPQKFKASVSVASSTSFNAGKNSALGTFSSSTLSSLFSSSTETTTPFQVFLSFTSSRILAKKIQENDALLSRMFPDRWDSQHSQWTPTGSLARKLFKLPDPAKPSTDEIMQFLNEHFEVTPMDRSDNLPVSIFILSAETKDADLSKTVLQYIIENADILTREKFETTYTEQIIELKKSLANEADIEIRSALNQMLSSVLTLATLAQSQGSYAIIQIDKNFDTDQIPSSPRPKLMLLSAFVFGIFISFVINIFIFQPDSTHLSNSRNS